MTRPDQSFVARPSRRRFLASSALFGAAATLPGLVRAQDAPLVVWNWTDYITDTTLDDFTAATGIDVEYHTFETNTELMEALLERNEPIDVAFPSSEYVERLIRQQALVPLDYDLLDNAFNVDPFFMDAGFDRGRAFSMPYMWGTVGLGFRKSVATPQTWAEVFDPAVDVGRVSLIGAIDTIQAALKALGHSANSADPAQIRAAADLIIGARGKIVGFPADEGYLGLLDGTVDVAMDWNGAVLEAMDEDEDIGFIVPTEGSMLWEDTMVIPRNGANPEAAHAFINFMLEAEVHAANAEESGYACPNAAARAFLSDEHLGNPVIYPPSEVLARCEPTFWPGEAVDELLRQELARAMAA